MSHDGGYVRLCGKSQSREQPASEEKRLYPSRGRFAKHEDKRCEQHHINKIEKTATEKYGMVHSESQNCITIGDSKSSSKTNLASAIKDEAYE